MYRLTVINRIFKYVIDYVIFENIFSELPNLTKLDNSDVTQEEKSKARSAISNSNNSGQDESFVVVHVSITSSSYPIIAPLFDWPKGRETSTSAPITITTTTASSTSPSIKRSWKDEMAT